MQHDFECADHGGTVATITPLTEAAHNWMTDNVPSYTLRRFPHVLNTLSGEPRYILDIALAMIEDGLACHNSDRVASVAA